MAACKNETSLNDLTLPAEFEDLEGLLRADLRQCARGVDRSAPRSEVLT